jgi:hypothetical protein
VPAPASPKNLAQRTPEIVFALFGFHFVSSFAEKLEAAPLLTTNQLQDSPIPSSGEETKLAGASED